MAPKHLSSDELRALEKKSRKATRRRKPVAETSEGMSAPRDLDQQATNGAAPATSMVLGEQQIPGGDALAGLSVDPQKTGAPVLPLADSSGVKLGTSLSTGREVEQIGDTLKLYALLGHSLRSLCNRVSPVPPSSSCTPLAVRDESTQTSDEGIEESLRNDLESMANRAGELEYFFDLEKKASQALTEEANKSEEALADARDKIDRLENEILNANRERNQMRSKVHEIEKKLCYSRDEVKRLRKARGEAREEAHALRTPLVAIPLSSNKFERRTATTASNPIDPAEARRLEDQLEESKAELRSHDRWTTEEINRLRAKLQLAEEKAEADSEIAERERRRADGLSGQLEEAKFAFWRKMIDRLEKEGNGAVSKACREGFKLGCNTYKSACSRGLLSSGGDLLDHKGHNNNIMKIVLESVDVLREVFKDYERSGAVQDIVFPVAPRPTSSVSITLLDGEEEGEGLEEPTARTSSLALTRRK